ncbi:MAG: transposase family protein [Pirellulales bacterium]|nr:transposase family protein [Pirellulales bacterium]
MKDKKALTQELARRYRRSDRKRKTAILDEFVKTTGYQRKYAIHLLANWGKSKTRIIDGELVNLVVGRPKKRKRVGRVIYGADVKVAVKELWEFFDYMCGKRLVVLIRMNIEALVRELELSIDKEVKRQLLSISAATIDRILKPEREKNRFKSRARTRPGSILKHQIPIRTFYPWDERLPGFFELDTVGHDGGSAAGEYCFTLNATDVYSGWVELRALRNRGHRWVMEQVINIRSELPFALKGVDTDNGGEFINKVLLNYCKEHEITFTRGRPYRKNDNCFVEQKNDMAVRRTVGYYRFDTEEEYEALRNVYKHLCPLLNFYYPSVRIIAKERIGSKVKKIYDEPKTPYMRLLESPFVDAEVKNELKTRAKNLQIVKQKRTVDRAVAHLLRVYEKKKQQTLVF